MTRPPRELPNAEFLIALPCCCRPTAAGSPCRNRVTTPGDRCHIHNRHPEDQQ